MIHSYHGIDDDDILRWFAPPLRVRTCPYLLVVAMMSLYYFILKLRCSISMQLKGPIIPWYLVLKENTFRLSAFDMKLKLIHSMSWSLN